MWMASTPSPWLSDSSGFSLCIPSLVAQCGMGLDSTWRTASLQYWSLPQGSTDEKSQDQCRKSKHRSGNGRERSGLEMGIRQWWDSSSSGNGKVKKRKKKCRTRKVSSVTYRKDTLIARPADIWRLTDTSVQGRSWNPIGFGKTCIASWLA